MDSPDTLSPEHYAEASLTHDLGLAALALIPPPRQPGDASEEN